MHEWNKARHRRAVARRLKEIRLSAGLAEAEIADAIGLSVRAYRRIESGERDLRYVEALLAAEALGTAIDELMVGTPARPGRRDAGKERRANVDIE